MARRFDPIALLIFGAVLVAIQQVRPFLSPLHPLVAWMLGVAPNFGAGLGLPFTWKAGARSTVRDHLLRCVQAAVGVCGYEIAQGVGVVPAHKRFDPGDFVASIAGAIVAAAIGVVLIRRRDLELDRQPAD